MIGTLKIDKVTCGLHVERAPESPCQRERQSGGRTQKGDAGEVGQKLGAHITENKRRRKGSQQYEVFWKSINEQNLVLT